MEKAAHFSIRPMLTFCCGMPLSAGVKLILVLHTASSFFYMATTLSNIVFEHPTLGRHLSPAIQSFNCGFAIASLPFIVAGVSGVRYHIEIHLRIYWLWLLFTYALDVGSVTVLLSRQSCAKLPSILTSPDGGGGSFACGIMRIGAIAFVVMSLVFAGYVLFAVWSYCEELKLHIADSSFDTLALKMGVGQPVAAGLFGTGASATTQPIPDVYGSIASQVVGGSVPLFGGSFHDCRYPPPSSVTH
mmetsp:Transcript_113656/g.321369  ORF Transcript_113656/g.321369 Transcript_113656/m.321369 type:complete len:245 (+) Transcript_113656:121-855(+)